MSSDDPFGDASFDNPLNSSILEDDNTADIDIPEDTDRYVYCRECGRKYQIILEGHLFISHGMTKEEYMTKHNLNPSHLIANDILLKKATKKKDNDVTKMSKVLVKLFNTHKGNFDEKFYRQNYGILVTQVIQAFGSWKKAVEYYKNNLV